MIRNFFVVIALSLVSPSVFAAPYVETYCFALPSALGGDVAKIKATFELNETHDLRVTREISALEVITGTTLKRASVVPFPMSTANRGKLMRADLMLDDQIFVKGVVTERVSFVASVRVLGESGADMNANTRQWTGVDPAYPHLRVTSESPEGTRILIDLIATRCAL